MSSPAPSPWQPQSSLALQGWQGTEVLPKDQSEGLLPPLLSASPPRMLIFLEFISYSAWGQGWRVGKYLQAPGGLLGAPLTGPRM